MVNESTREGGESTAPTPGAWARRRRRPEHGGRGESGDPSLERDVEVRMEAGVFQVSFRLSLAGSLRKQAERGNVEIPQARGLRDYGSAETDGNLPCAIGTSPTS